MIRRLLIALVLLVIIVAALFAFYRWRERPMPTVAGWRAHVSTLAGDGSPGTLDAATATAARFQDPFGIAVDRNGNVYVADAGESNRIRKVTPEGAVATLAGGAEGFADGAGAAASFNTPSALAIDEKGNLYVADTGNNRIRKVTPEGIVTTIAGDGMVGSHDGAAQAAQFNAPVGVAVDVRGEHVYVADTYNDRIRRITTADGQVTTIAGGGGSGDAGGTTTGYADGAAANAMFDTPCALAVTPDGELFIADTGNRRLRKLSQDGQVSTVNLAPADGSQFEESFAPVGLALTHDKFLYLAERAGGRIWQLAPDGRAYLIADNNAPTDAPTAGGNDDDAAAATARFNQLAGIAVDRRGALYVADSANYLVRKLTPDNDTATTHDAAAAIKTSEATGAVNQSTGSDSSSSSNAPGNSPLISPGGALHDATDRAASPPGELDAPLPHLSAAALGITSLPWPLDPQQSKHEVIATLGEVRGSYDTNDGRDHLHSGIDISGTYGQTARAVFDEKVESPLTNWGYGTLNEGVRVGLFVYVHLRVGRNAQDKLIDERRFQLIRDAAGTPSRIRLKRGTRFRVGDALGTLNRMYHVHLNFGAPNAEQNPLTLPLIGFTDKVAPTIERDGIQFFDAANGGARFTDKRDGRLIIPRGKVRIVVDAYDQVDGNLARRRLGLYRLGYQLLRADGTPAPGFEQPLMTIEFDRLPPEREAVKIAYAGESGITVYGNESTRFLYEATNRVRHGRAERSAWDTSALPAGDYTLRIHASDFNGNEATTGRDVAIRIEGK